MRTWTATSFATRLHGSTLQTCGQSTRVSTMVRDALKCLRSDSWSIIADSSAGEKLPMCTPSAETRWMKPPSHTATLHVVNLLPRSRMEGCSASTRRCNSVVLLPRRESGNASIRRPKPSHNPTNSINCSSVSASGEGCLVVCLRRATRSPVAKSSCAFDAECLFSRLAFLASGFDFFVRHVCFFATVLEVERSATLLVDEACGLVWRLRFFGTGVAPSALREVTCSVSRLRFATEGKVEVGRGEDGRFFAVRRGRGTALELLASATAGACWVESGAPEAHEDAPVSLGSSFDISMTVRLPRRSYFPCSNAVYAAQTSSGVRDLETRRWTSRQHVVPSRRQPSTKRRISASVHSLWHERRRRRCV